MSPKYSRRIVNDGYNLSYIGASRIRRLDMPRRKSVLSPGSMERYMQGIGKRGECCAARRVTGPLNARQGPPDQRGSTSAAWTGPGRAADGARRDGGSYGATKSAKQCSIIIKRCFYYRFTIIDAESPGKRRKARPERTETPTGPGVVSELE